MMRLPSEDGAIWRARPPMSRTVVARLVQVAGIMNILTSLFPPRHGRMAALGGLMPVAGILTAHAAVAAAGLLFLYLGAGLRRGKHRAWQVAVGLAGTGVVLHLARGLGYGAAAFSAVLLVILLVTRNQFRALADPPNRWRPLLALVGFAGAGFLLGFAEIAVRVNRLQGRPGWLSWAAESALGVLGITGPVHFRHAIGAEAVSLTTGGFGLLAVAVSVVLLLHPGTRMTVRSEQDDRTLRGLLDRHGSGDSLGYFALRGDKSLIWGPGDHAVIAYRVCHGVSLAAGDPIGAASEWPGAINAWLAECASHGWTPAVLGCGNAGGRAYRKAGLDVVELGDEAIVDVPAFQLEGRAMRGVRQAVRRMQRAGFTCEVVRQRDLSEVALAEAVRAAETFRDGAVERGFSMALSRFGDPRDEDCLLVLCHDGSGRLRGLLQFVPWGCDGLSLDLMRGDRTAGNGLTELMVIDVIAAAPALGVRQISLNFAVLRSVFARAEDLGAGPVLRLWHRLLMLASRVWQIESLYRANAKFQPAWQPRYLCFPTARDLPRIAVAALTAEAFLPDRTPPAGLLPSVQEAR